MRYFDNSRKGFFLLVPRHLADRHSALQHNGTQLSCLGLRLVEVFTKQASLFSCCTVVILLTMEAENCLREEIRLHDIEHNDTQHHNTQTNNIMSFSLVG